MRITDGEFDCARGFRVDYQPTQQETRSVIFSKLEQDRKNLLEAAKVGLAYVESEEGSDHSDSDLIKKAIAQAEAKS